MAKATFATKRLRQEHRVADAPPLPATPNPYQARTAPDPRDVLLATLKRQQAFIAALHEAGIALPYPLAEQADELAVLTDDCLFFYS